MMDKQQEIIRKYFDSIDAGIKSAYKTATEARKRGLDPSDEVEVPLVRDMAERVEGLISVVAPQIRGSGVSKRIKELEKQYGALDWRIALILALEVAQQKFCKFKSQHEAIEIGIRTGFAYHTMGVVSSPLEGFVRVTFRKRKDNGKEYMAVSYAGPIRSAGGTGASVSAIICDYVRKNLGYEAYDPTEQEVNRIATELYDYHDRITNLQYLPSEEEIKFLIRHIPIQIDGDGSERIEVSNYKDLDRIDTNRIRNGVCLVVGEGIAQKAPKLLKQIEDWGDDFGLGNWKFLKEFVEMQKGIKAKGTTGGADSEKQRVTPDYTFIKDLVAGRPILTHPMRDGGFRLRYGRARTSGYSSYCIHPATMHILNKYLAVGTQLKLERPGKASAITACDSIEGPIVKFNDGTVSQIHTLSEAKSRAKEIEEILFLGDMLVNYGDFFNRAHKLVPAGYCEEWWVQEVEKSIVDHFGALDLEKAAELTGISYEVLARIMKEAIPSNVSAHVAVNLSKKLDTYLHPKYTYHFKVWTKNDLLSMLKWMDKANVVRSGDRIEKIILPYDDRKRLLEIIGIPHVVANKEFIVLDKDHALALGTSLGVISSKPAMIIEKVAKHEEADGLSIINNLSDVKLRDKSGIFIGARMGRPEKAKMRRLDGSPQVLFPIGAEGGRLRCFQSALDAGKVTGDFPLYYCGKCKSETIYAVCETCGKKTIHKYVCRTCGVVDKPECEHGETMPYSNRAIDIKHYFESALKKLGAVVYPDLIKGVKGTSNKEHSLEHVGKGILRAKHDIYVNKDGTTRYDMTQLPITHFKPTEIGTSVEKLKELGYLFDVYGKPLENPEQIVELLPQDVVLPACEDSPDEGANKVLMRTCQFIDEMLKSLYGVRPFYNVKAEEDLVGHLAIALAPHTAAGIVTRIIGFSKTQGFFAHPLLHAATRRDCDGDEACVTLLMDVLLNFSRHFLPAHRGATQDAPLVITSKVIPSEVDDMAFDIDVVWKYPLEFYEACLEYKNPWEISIEQLGKRLNTPSEYYGHGFTHHTSNLNSGVMCSDYKTLPSMEDKLKGQMDLAERIRAVETSDVARLVIEKHFIRDTKGNLRKFSMQQFRCVNYTCGEKYRRLPLAGKCLKCGGKIIFTISEGSVIKYLEPSISLANKYNLPSYLKQSLELLQRDVDGVFGRDKEQQMGLGAWFG